MKAGNADAIARRPVGAELIAWTGYPCAAHEVKRSGLHALFRRPGQLCHGAPDERRAPMDLRGKRIGLLTASASRAGGGVFEAVVAQTEIIRLAGGDPMVFALKDEHSCVDHARFGGVPVAVFPVIGPGQVGFSPKLLGALLAAELDCLHLHGIWMYPSQAGSVWARRTGRPYIISPHGMLDPWITARGRWKKALARFAYERTGWRCATALHALTGREAQDIFRETRRKDTVVIPNAGPPGEEPAGELPGPTVVYIGRVHPKKNLENLVEGWSLADRPAGARLILAGWGDPSSLASLEGAVGRAGSSVEFIGPVFGNEKKDLLASARFVVLPSYSEGLPMAILEAWALGKPTVMTEQCNLPEGFDTGAALECGYEPQAMAAVLTKALAMAPGQWHGMAYSAAKLARSRFSQEVVSAQWSAAYATALGQSRPDVEACR